MRRRARNSDPNPAGRMPTTGSVSQLLQEFAEAERIEAAACLALGWRSVLRFPQLLASDARQRRGLAALFLCKACGLRGLSLLGGLAPRLLGSLALGVIDCLAL